MNRNSNKSYLKSDFLPHAKHIASSTEVLALYKVVGFFPDTDKIQNTYTLWQSAECILMLNQVAHIVNNGLRLYATYCGLKTMTIISKRFRK